MRLRFSLWLTVGLSLGLSGCQHARRHVHEVREHPASNLPVVESRPIFDLDFQEYPKLEPATVGEFAGPYRLLTERECQCLAAAASSQGSLLEKEARQAAPKRHGKRRRADLQQNLLLTYSEEARNRDAGNALQLFYKLAEAEARWDLLKESIARVEDLVRQGRKIKARGAKVPAEFEEFRRQGIDLLADQARLAVNIHKLNVLLGQMLDLHDVPDAERIWPAVDIRVETQAVDPAEALATGLANRPELVFLRQVSQQGNLAGLDAARKLLASSNPLMGASSKCCLAKLKAILCDREGASRSEQLEEYREQREREISDEIRQAVVAVHGQVQLLAVARQRVHNAQRKYQEQNAKRAKGTAGALEPANAHLALIKAQAEMIQEAMGWFAARAKLKQAQGLLGLECHYGHGDAHHFAPEVEEPSPRAQPKENKGKMVLPELLTPSIMSPSPSPAPSSAALP